MWAACGHPGWLMSPLVAMLYAFGLTQVCFDGAGWPSCQTPPLCGNKGLGRFSKAAITRRCTVCRGFLNACRAQTLVLSKGAEKLAPSRLKVRVQYIAW